MKFDNAMMRRIMGTLILFLAVNPCHLAAQNISLNDADIGILVSTNGVGFTSSFPIHLEHKELQSVVNFSFQTIKHPQEAKVQNLNYANPKPYIFGKINQGGTLRLGYGLQRQLSKNEKAFPSVSVQLSSGGTLGILKPYYVRFDNPGDQNGTQTIQQNNTTSENQDRIVSPASWTKGFSEITTTAGVHTSISLDIDWDQSYSHKSLSLGLRADYFFEEFNTLLNNNNQLFLSLFATYSFGKNRV